MICFLVGPVQSGKTTAAGEILSGARKAGLRVGGVLCPGEIAAGVRTSINVRNLATGEVSPLADTRGPGPERVGRFHFSEDGLELGRRALRLAIRSRPALAVIDEIGALELAGRGWGAETDRLVDEYRTHAEGLLLLVVRSRLVDRAREQWGLAATPIVRAEDARVVHLVLAMARGEQAQKPDSSDKPRG